MDLKEYRAEYLNTIEIGSSVNRNFNRSEFVDAVMKELVESEELSDFTPVHYDGTIGPKRKRIEFDGYDYDDYDNTFTLVVCKYSGIPDTSEKITRSDIESMVDRAKTFIEGSISRITQDSLEESERAVEVAEMIHSISDEIVRYRIFVLSDLEKSDRIKSVEIEPIDGKQVLLKLWDISNLYELNVSKKGYDDIEINLSDFGYDGLPCIRTFESSEDFSYDSYLCAIPGRLLSDLYEKYGSRLLDSNVRSFLKLTTKTNKNIRATILKEPHMFFAYNNGITTTATDIIVESVKDSLLIKGFTALQIVNGGQTTVTLYTVGKSRDKPDLSKIYVPMKVSVVDREHAEEIIPKISRSANTQNKVSEADFFSNSPFHKTIQDLSRRTMTPQVSGVPYSTRWFYERTRGQYQQEISRRTGSEASKFKTENPKSQMFTKTDLAKYRLSYAMRPDIVSKGAQYALLEFSKSVDTEHLDEYNDLYFKETIALAIMFRRLEKMVPGQPWYQGGYRAQIVTYSIARLVALAESMGGVIDLMKIWDMQSLPKPLEEQLILIMESVNESITQENEEANVAQWCKKEKCWKKVKEAYVEQCDSFTKCLVSKKHENFNQKIARRDKRNSQLINARIEVVNLGGAFFQDAYDWGCDHDMLDGYQKSQLRVAINQEIRLPSEKQSKEIMKILEMLREGGYNR
ncbi:MAG: AIPR family protein [Candidatus Methanomethylophilaceae archaeon]|nr:AIPR family protein [Candidatus Methanomethylophilaceae archaeon]